MLLSQKFAVIGNGIAAVEAIRMMRLHNYQDEIHLFSNETWPAYNPMLTTYYAAGKMDFEAFFPCGSNMDFYHQHHVNLHLGSPVMQLDVQKQKITNESGYELQYDKCLIASGASCFLPPIEGIKSKKVLTVRTIDDSLALKNALQEKPDKVLVVGASMTGIKIVELFLNAGSDVCLADQAHHIFPLAAHPACAEKVEDSLEKMGVKMRLGAAISRIVEQGDGIEAYFADHDLAEKADFIVLCIGARSNMSFVNQDEVATGAGVLVDDHMCTNVENLYAAGDVAQGTNLLTGKKETIALWANARYQGRTAGANMAGVNQTYPGNIPHNITHFLDMDFVGIGDVRNGSREEEIVTKDGYYYLVFNDKGLQGINMFGRFHESGLVKSTMIKRLLLHNNLPTGNYDFSNDLLMQYIKKTILYMG